jgi:uncharacterized protein (TIGR03437 family)
MNIANPVSASFGDFPLKNAFRLSLIALMLVCLAAGWAAAQTATPSPTPRDSAFTQVTSSNADAFTTGISGNGRFVVFESTGDLATLNPLELTRAVNNADGNREIYLYDYAQRRIFQITNTTSARVDATKPAITLNTTTGRPDFSNVAVEVSSNRPFISRDGRWIVFSSNADTPFSFDGDANKTALQADGNQEIFLYLIPGVAAADLRSGVDIAFQNLRLGDFTRVTDTAASRVPVAGTASTTPIVADDNRSAQLNDRGSRIVFISTRNKLVAGGSDFKNPDFNPEIFVWNRTSPLVSQAPPTGVFVQVTNTSGAFTFNSNPSISGGTSGDADAELPGSVIAFISNATAISNANDTAFTINNADGNAEVFVATYDGAAATAVTQATRTQRENPSSLVNVLNPGPRLSRDGRFVAFESVAANPGANATTNEPGRGLFVYTIASDTFTLVGPRSATLADEDPTLRFPVFAGTGDSTQIVWTSALNFTPTGTRLALADTTGMNPLGFKQIYSLPVPFTTTSQTITRLTNTTSGGTGALQPYVGNTTERIAFSFNGELGGGNGAASLETIASAELFYLNVQLATPTSDTPASASALSYFTGATAREVVTPAASPTPTPSPTPTATPITGLAPGMIGIVRAPETEGAVRFAAAATRICEPQDFCDAASESRRRPSLPVELTGVSLSINNAAAGLYFVSPTEIQFVVPAGLTPLAAGSATYPVVIHVNDGSTVRTIRSALQIVQAQPDIFTRPEAPTRAFVFNVTNGTSMGEPPDGFPVTSPNMAGAPSPTILAIFLTGVRNPAITRANVTVSIGDRNLTGNDIVQLTSGSERAFRPTDMPGVDQLNLQLRADMAGLGDQPLVISVTIGGQTFTSRPAATAPRIRIK